MNEVHPRPMRRSVATNLVSAVNNERIVFTAADRVPKRKSKKRLKPPGVFLNDTDRQIVELIRLP